MQSGIGSGGAEVVLTLTRETAARARITGRVLLADGKPATGEEVSAGCTDARRFSEECVVGTDGEFAIDVPAGTWMLGVTVKGHAGFRSEAQRLEFGTTWNAGTIHLDRGGTVRVNDGERPTLGHRIVTPDGRFVAVLHTPLPPPRSDLLNPGDYVLLIHGSQIAAQAIPF
ncbi:MAG TPA: hypothetical protein VFZ65_06995, partial [Planctomycetota bacterium]|nr:hypothetical protein [Planctomycetota bacterium]